MYKQSSQVLFNLRSLSVITPIWATTSISTVPAPMARHVTPVKTAAGSSKPQCCLVHQLCSVQPQLSQQSGTEKNVAWWSFHSSREDVLFFLSW